MTRPAGNPLDLRAWLETARSLGELKDVKGADAKLELGAISELNVKKDAAPALLFDDIKDYPNGYRVLTCSTASPAPASTSCARACTASFASPATRERRSCGWSRLM